jgi:CheY-like chemotaxis protein
VKTILIVDDEPGSAEALALLLDDQGYCTICAHDGREGLACIAAGAPDLVLLDLMMPVMSGGDMARALRASEATRHIKIIINSSLNEASVRDYFSAYDAFLRKPFGLDDLLRIIALLLAD